MIKKTAIQILILFTIFGPSITLGQKNDLSATFQVIKIEKVKNGYAIDLLNIKDSAYYTIVSLNGRHAKLEKLIVGKNYYLKICPYFSVDGKKYIPDLRIIYEISIDGTLLYVNSRSWTSNIYTSEQVIGKFYKKE